MSFDRIADPAARERARLEDLKPSLDALKGMRGFRHQVKRDKDGKILKQRYRFKANENGKLTREARIVQEMHRPYWEAKLGLEAKLRGMPGDFGGRGSHRSADFTACRDYCPTCDRLRVWCECQ